MANIVKYQARDGNEVELTMETMKKYLIRGRAEAVTAPEMVMAMGICKARGLNPFAGDAYLIKVTESDPLAVVVSIDFYRARAKAQKDCKGWKSGIILLRDGQIIYSDGLMLPGDELLGGWFKALPSGWEEPFTLEVNLAPYIKKTRAGEITKFWRQENQPFMIRKVAESQGLREVWPAEFSKLYLAEEIDAGAIRDDFMDVPFAAVGEQVQAQAQASAPATPKKSEPDTSSQPTTNTPVSGVAAFDAQVPTGTDEKILAEFIKKCVVHFKVESVDAMKEKIIRENSFADFYKNFLAYWRKATERPPAGQAANPPPEQVQSDLPAAKHEVLRAEIGRMQHQTFRNWVRDNKERISAFDDAENIVFKSKFRKAFGADFDFDRVFNPPPPQSSPTPAPSLSHKEEEPLLFGDVDSGIAGDGEATKEHQPVNNGSNYRVCKLEDQRRVPIAAKCSKCSELPVCEAKERFVLEVRKFEEELPLARFNRALMSIGYKEVDDVKPDKFDEVLAKLRGEFDMLHSQK